MINHNQFQFISIETYFEFMEQKKVFSYETSVIRGKSEIVIIVINFMNFSTVLNCFSLNLNCLVSESTL